MKTLNKFILRTTLSSAIFFAVFITNTAFAANLCSPQDIQEFKKLYIALQQELNYEGQDAYLDNKGNLKLRPHDPNKPYGGKVFEEAIFKEYQNSLKKVAKFYQDAKFNKDEKIGQNKVLVDFLAAIEKENDDNSQYISNTKIDEVIDALAKASQNKFNSDENKKFAINDGDKYLLKKLLTHAQDRICSVRSYERSGGKGTKYFDANYLKQVQNAPLNRLVTVLRNSGIKQDSDITVSNSQVDLVDPTAAISSAVANNVNNLVKWMKDKKSKCLAKMQTKDFTNKIQADIQICNYREFVNTISQNNVDNLEAVLHFINANEKFLNYRQPKAETDLNEIKLEGFISQTFEDLGSYPNCMEVKNEQNGKKKIFVHNLPFLKNENKFDTKVISCKLDGKALVKSDCEKNYELVSDELGRGLEFRPKKNYNQKITYDIESSPTCKNINFDSGELNKNVDADLNSGKNEPKMTKEKCEAQKKEGFIFKWNEKDLSCTEEKTMTAEQCVAQKKEGFIFNWDEKNKTCVEVADDALNGDGDADLNTNPLNKEQCLAQKEEGMIFKWDEEKKSCNSEADPKFALEKECLDKKADGFKFTYDAEKGCVQTPIMNKESCEKKSSDTSIFKWNDEKQTCTEEKVSGDKLACQEKNKKWMAEESEKNDGRPAPTKYAWDDTKKECVDKRPAKEVKDTGDAGDMPALNFDQPSNKPIPSRFTPTNIPTRQMYILPGMR